MAQNPDDRDVRIGKELALLRRLAGRTQADVASAVGVTEQQISKYERGDDRVSKSRYDAIVEFLTDKPISGFAQSPAAFIAPARDFIERTELAKVITELATLVVQLEACLRRLRTLVEQH